MMYIISVCHESADTNPRREWYEVATRKTERSALKKATSESKKSYEAEVQKRTTAGDVLKTWVFRSGQLVFELSEN